MEFLGMGVFSFNRLLKSCLKGTHNLHFHQSTGDATPPHPCPHLVFLNHTFFFILTIFSNYLELFVFLSSTRMISFFFRKVMIFHQCDVLILSEL